MIVREVPVSNPGLVPTILTGFLMVFLSPSRKMLGQYLKFGHENFFSHPLKFIILLSSFHSTMYILNY